MSYNLNFKSIQSVQKYYFCKTKNHEVSRANTHRQLRNA